MDALQKWNGGTGIENEARALTVAWKVRRVSKSRDCSEERFLQKKEFNIDQCATVKFKREILSCAYRWQLEDERSLFRSKRVRLEWDKQRLPPVCHSCSDIQ